jgi:hypothetical protein
MQKMLFVFLANEGGGKRRQARSKPGWGSSLTDDHLGASKNVHLLRRLTRKCDRSHNEELGDMHNETKVKSSNITEKDIEYLRRRVRAEAEAACDAGSLAATLIHVALATAYAKRCCYANDQTWVAETRLW